MSERSRQRLDLALVARGLVESRQKAQGLIMAGRVRLDGRPAVKAGAGVSEEARIEVLPGPEHVGRGALKLAGALDVLGVDPAGRVAVDVGASTGGFTEVLLARGAVRVYAVDVGRGQLHETLRADPRVVVLEEVNARRLSTREVPEPCGVATLDVSFISVCKLLPALRLVLSPEADVVVLVKPQFELARRDVGRGGIVRGRGLHRQALEAVARSARLESGYALLNACSSPITGADGNREFFLHLRPAGAALPAGAEEAMIAAALET